MDQFLSQEENREFIIKDMVEIRSSIVPIIGDDTVVFKESDISEEIPLQQFILQEFQRKYPYVEVCESDVQSMKNRGYYGLSLLWKYYNTQHRFLNDFRSFINENKSCIKLKDEVKAFLVTFNFPIIITTICFDVIEEQLKGIIESYKSIWYQPNKKNETLPTRCVYHIFGQIQDGTSSSWVSNEDLLLRFLLSHNHNEYGAKGLIDFLNEDEKRLFVLGCNLPNWLFRFLWQPTQNGRVNSKMTVQGYWINKDKPEDSFEYFLKEKNFSTDEQVKEILVDATKRLNEKLEKETEALDKKNNNDEHFDVFISYASEDRAIATAIFERLKNMNVSAWFDDRGKGEITPGQSYWDRIEKGIKRSAHFMPIITGNWMGKLTSSSSLKDETVMAQDWLIACSKPNSLIHLDTYSIPVIVSGSTFNQVPITESYIEKLADMTIIPKDLFYRIDMLLFDGKDYSGFEKIDW